VARLPVERHEWKVVPSFAGGLDYSKHPAFLQDDQWTETTGWIPRNGYAETAPAFTGPSNGSPIRLFIGDKITGIHKNAMTKKDALVTTSDVLGANGRLFTVSGLGVVANVTPAAPRETRRGVATSSFAMTNAALQTRQLICFGYKSGGGNVATWDGTTATAMPGLLAGSIAFDYIASFKSHAIGVAGDAAFTTEQPTREREFAWSAVNAFDIWGPLVGNDASAGIIDDSPDGITGLFHIGPETLCIATGQSLHALIPTGGDPAFSRQQLSRGIGVYGLGVGPVGEFGSTAALDRQHLWGTYPAGAIFYSGARLMSAGPGGLQSIGDRIFEVWSKNVRASFDPASITDILKPFCWHEALGLMVIGFPTGTLADQAIFYFDPQTGAWGRQVLGDVGTGAFRRMGYILTEEAGSVLKRRLWISTTTDVYTERSTSETPAVGAQIDTKDFTFGVPAMTAEVDRIKVDWEPLGTSTNRLKIEMAARNEMSVGLPGSITGQVAFPAVTASGFIGSATVAGLSDLPCRVRGKYFRLRFTATDGPARIRGFSIRWRPAGDRRT